MGKYLRKATSKRLILRKMDVRGRKKTFSKSLVKAALITIPMMEDYGY
jgi:hypothetical protein